MSTTLNSAAPGNSLDRITGGAFGQGLEDNIYSAYRFLILNYEIGDEIYLFGFSRGAFTARSLIGMIRKCGILARLSIEQYHAAVRLYCDPHNPDEDGPLQFRCTHSIAKDARIPVKFVGVWDTVGSLGIPLRGLRALTRNKYKFHDVQLSSTVENAYQALAIDERRAPFEAARWAYMPTPGQNIQQVWFAGVHSDVGGGYPQGEWGLSDIALQWMRDKAVATGLRLDDDVDQAYAPKPSPLAAMHNSKTKFYRLAPGIDRVIGRAALPTEQPDSDTLKHDPTQSLHPSVLVRWDNDASYRPKNLRDYFQFAEDARSGN